MAEHRPVDPDHLPPRARDLAEIIGLPALLALVEWRGGVYVVVPKYPKEGQRIVSVLGLAAARALAEVYGGEAIEVPKCEAAARAALHAAIVARREHESEMTVALDTGYTGRHIRRICAQHRRREDSGQGELGF